MTDTAPIEPSSTAVRYRRVAASFTDVVESISGDDWERPSPCAGWVARDIVEHLVEWVPGFFASVGAPAAPEDPSADLAGAWRAIDGWVQATLDDPERAAAIIDHPMAGTHPVEVAIERFVTGDVLVHTWDLAQSQGREVDLDPESVENMLAGLAAMGDMLEASGMFGAPVAVGADADAQARLIAISGRQP